MSELDPKLSTLTASSTLSLEKKQQQDPAESSKEVSKDPSPDNDNNNQGSNSLNAKLTVLAYFFFNFSTWGSNSSFSIYLTHYLKDPNFSNASKLDYAAIGGLQYGAGLLVLPFVSDLIIKRLGERGLIFIGIVSQVLANICASYSKELWQLYITQGLLQSFGISFIVIPGYSLIPKWFKNGNKTFAQGLTNCGTSLGGLFFCLFNEKLISMKGISFTLKMQCIICVVLDLAGLALVRIPQKGPNAPVHESIIKQSKVLLKNVGFWIQLIWGIFNMAGFLIMLYVLSDFTVSLGFSSHQGSIIASMVSVGAIFGRPICGILSDKFGAINVTLITQSIVVILIFAMWIPANSIPVLVVFGLLIGSIMGTLFTSMSSITVEVLQGDLSLLINAINVFLFVLALASTIAPILALALKNGSTYRNAIIFTGFMNFGSVIALVALRYVIIGRKKKAQEDLKNVYSVKLV